MADEASAGAATSEPGTQQTTTDASTGAGTQAQATGGTTLVTTEGDGAAAGTQTTKGDGTAVQGAEGETGKAGDDKGEGTKPQATPVTDTFTAPEGVELDKSATAELVAIFNDEKLSPQERAQKLVDLELKRQNDQVAQHAATVATWVDAVRADKDIGGEKLAENLAVAKKALALAPPDVLPELKQLLDVSGFGNHLAFVKWMHAVGKQLSEPRLAQGRTGGDATPIAQRMYPGMNP